MSELEREQFLTTLLETACQQVWIDGVVDYVDSIEMDSYENAVAKVKDDGEITVVVTSHIDAVGYVVRRIDEQGYLHAAGVGGVDAVCVRGQCVRVHGSDGVVVHTPSEMYDWGVPQLTDLAKVRIDIGAESQEDARSRVPVGDPVTVAMDPTQLTNGRIAARCYDNRTGAYLIAEVVRYAARTTPAATVLGVSTVQEEIGRRGASMISAEYDVDAVLVVDAGVATDSPKAPTSIGNEITLGGGPIVARGGGNHSRLVSAVRSVADTSGRPIQFQATLAGTGTDADAFAAEGGPTPTLYLGFPTRNLHTTVEVVDVSDLKTTIELLTELLSMIGKADGRQL